MLAIGFDRDSAARSAARRLPAGGAAAPAGARRCARARLRATRRARRSTADRRASSSVAACSSRRDQRLTTCRRMVEQQRIETGSGSRELGAQIERRRRDLQHPAAEARAARQTHARPAPRAATAPAPCTAVRRCAAHSSSSGCLTPTTSTESNTAPGAAADDRTRRARVRAATPHRVRPPVRPRRLRHVHRRITQQLRDRDDRAAPAARARSSRPRALRRAGSEPTVPAAAAR